MIKNLFLLLSFISVSAFSSSAPLDSLINKLNFIDAMQANFSQKVYQGERVIQQSRGRLYLQRRQKFRWQETSPSTQLIVSNGEKIWIYEEDLEQVTIKSIGTKIKDTPILLLNSDKKQLDKEYVVKHRVVKSKDLYKLLPKNKLEQAYVWLQLTYEQDKLVELLVEDNLAQRTRLTFSKIIINKKEGDTLFEFIPPKGVDIVQ